MTEYESILFWKESQYYKEVYEHKKLQRYYMYFEPMYISGIYDFFLDWDLRTNII